MDIKDLNEQLHQRLEQVKQYVESDDLKDTIGTVAVDFFKDSFKNEGFTDETLVKWDDVKRRDPSSPWYGHSGFSSEKPKKKIKKGDTTLVGNFSQARTTAKILTGETSELRESITYQTTAKGARITSDKPYSAVHQFGGKAYIYGKHEFQMIARPYMGRSKKLIQELQNRIQGKFEIILKGK